MSATVFQRTDHRARPAWHKKSSRARARTNEQALKPAASDAGNAVKGSGNFGETSRRSEQIGFTGRYLDKETGLYYFRARYYSGTLGRFIGRDPLGYVDGHHLYMAYFAPNFVDPQGLYKDDSGDKDDEICDIIDNQSKCEGHCSYLFKWDDIVNRGTFWFPVYICRYSLAPDNPTSGCSGKNCGCPDIGKSREQHAVFTLGIWWCTPFLYVRKECETQ